MTTSHPKATGELDMRIGARIRGRRRAVGMSQSELAQHLGMTFQQIQKYEKGMNRVSAVRLNEIARILRTPVNVFFDPVGDDDHNMYMIKGSDELYRAIASLPSDAREHITSLTAMMAKMSAKTAQPN